MAVRRVNRAFGLAFVAVATVAPSAAHDTAAATRPLRAPADVRSVPSVLRDVVEQLRVRTSVPILVPGDVRSSGSSLRACLMTADRFEYGYFLTTEVGDSPCRSEPTGIAMMLSARPWQGPFLRYGRRLRLPHDVDADVTDATGFDDPTSPRNDEVIWHLGATRYELDVGSGDTAMLARSMLANSRSPARSQHLTVSPEVARVGSTIVEAGLRAGVAFLRRGTKLAVYVPRRPEIANGTQLFPLSRSVDGYAYILCSTIDCGPHERVVANVSVTETTHQVATPTVGVTATPDQDLDGRLPPVALGCGVRASYDANFTERDVASVITWRSFGMRFEITTARSNPTRTNVLALARSIVRNACGRSAALDPEPRAERVDRRDGSERRERAREEE